MNIEQFLDFIKLDKSVMKNVTMWNIIPQKDPQFSNYPPNIDHRIVKALKKRRIDKLYTHQALSWEKVREGKNIVVVTPTASGKTLCYNLPVIENIINKPQGRALYMFPTKALAQDQVTELQDIINEIDVDIKTFTYDGDTPTTARRAIRKAGHIIVTNPDMLHGSILPNHTKWLKLFENLKYIIIDEIHHYRGIFGSHVANVIRRLKRIAKFYGANPIFICCSATIKNPMELTKRIIEEEVDLINQNGAPAGEKHFIFYNPPVVNWQLGIRKSVLLETKKIASALIANGIQTIVFARTRLSCEILTTYLKEAIKSSQGEKSQRIRGYRGGYLPKKRREIEKGLRSGDVLGVISTNALELGIDIGKLQAVVMAGYPGTIASTWQQAGRAGRRQSSSVVFLVASSSSLNQFIISHPEYFFGENIESGLINPDNLYILVNHVKCACFELPFEKGESFGAHPIGEILGFLEEKEIVHYCNNRWHWSCQNYPAEDISLRSATSENFVIIDVTNTPRVIGEVDRFTAPLTLHEEAIYLHESQQYQVEKLDYENKKAFVRSVKVDYYTDAEMSVNVKILNVDRKNEDLNGIQKFMGDVQVSALVAMFKKIKFHTHENIGSGPISLPEQDLHTTAYWVIFSQNIIEGLSNEEISSGISGVSNLLKNIAPVYLMCDPRDLRSSLQIKSPFTYLPTIFLYDIYPGGIGLSEKIFYLHEELFKGAKNQLKSCSCAYGCPSCVGPPLDVGTKGKEIALKIFENLEY